LANDAAQHCRQSAGEFRKIRHVGFLAVFSALPALTAASGAIDNPGVYWLLAWRLPAPRTSKSGSPQGHHAVAATLLGSIGVAAQAARPPERGLPHAEFDGTERRRVGQCR
jgi:hypothetical protein